MNEATKGKLIIAGSAIVVTLLVYFAILTDCSAAYVIPIISGIITGLSAYKDNNVSARNVWFQSLKPIVKKYGLELLQEAVEGLDELQEDPEDDEELPQ